MNIRKIKDSDVKPVSLLMMRNFDEIMKKHHSEGIIEKFKAHNTAEKLTQQMFWKDILVVEENNEIVATGAVANFGDQQNPKYSISNFFVKPELHRQGIGKALFNELRNIAIEKGAEIFHVPSSRNAVEFYSFVGFEVDEKQPDLEDEITWMSMKISS
jgi:predicted N-acetyltransferase YhbS